MNDQLRLIWTELVSASASYGGDRRSSRWVMDRLSYDRIRAAAMTDEQELNRALAHFDARILVLSEPPYACPACPAGPFATMAELSEHVRAMADPTNKEPQSGDYLLGIPVEVRDDGGAPHLEPVTP